MLVRESRQRPQSWAERRASIRRAWTVPLHRFDWVFQWTSFLLSRWAFLETLEYLGALSLLFGVILYCFEAGNRQKQKNYEAWQVINTAQGKGGSGGRIEALQDLNADGVPLVGVDVSGAFLQGVRLPHARLDRANFRAADARDSVLARSVLVFAALGSVNFRGGDLSGANLEQADLEDADLAGAILAGARLDGANLKNADLSNCDLRGIAWRNIRTVESANVYGVRNAPPGFLDWARQHGAVSVLSGNQ